MTAIVLIHHDNERVPLVATREDGTISTEARKNAPEWARGITKVLVSSRLAFYSSRVSPEQLELIRAAPAFNLRDLDYIRVDEHGGAIEVPADPEWRMEYLAALYAVTRTAELDQESYGVDASIRAQVEIGMDGARNSDEEAANELAQATLRTRPTVAEE